MLRKNWDALGSFPSRTGPRSVDLLGFASQLMFTTALLNYSSCWSAATTPTSTYAVARAHNAPHGRFLLGRQAPAADRLRAAASISSARAQAAREAIELGAKALMIPSRCPDDHSPSHIGFDPLWAMAQEAGLPIVFHVGGGGKLLETPTSTTACRRCRTSTAATTISSRSTTWRSPIRR